MAIDLASPGRAWISVSTIAQRKRKPAAEVIAHHWPNRLSIQWLVLAFWVLYICGTDCNRLSCLTQCTWTVCCPWYEGVKLLGRDGRGGAKCSLIHVRCATEPRPVWDPWMFRPSFA